MRIRIPCPECGYVGPHVVVYRVEEEFIHLFECGHCTHNFSVTDVELEKAERL